jgi:uncharacterized Zn-binding protein involved in type VI secretion
MPAAARVGDKHCCEKLDPVPHGGGSILDPACPTVFIGARNAARVGDLAFCDGGDFDVILTGEPTVLVGGKPAARLGDATDGGHVTTGQPSVLIGANPRKALLEEAARAGVPFVELTSRARLQRNGQ